jgi:hypothetical protein
MAIQDNKDEIKIPEKPASPEDQAIHFKQEGERIIEGKENSFEDKIVVAELRKEIEMMELDPSLKKEAEVAKERIEYLGEKEKIEHLLQLAREKGLVYAIQIAKKMNEPYLLDILHDTLAQEGLYLKVAQNTDDNSDDDNKTKI